MRIILLILCMILIFSACSSKKEIENNDSSNIQISVSSEQESEIQSQEQNTTLEINSEECRPPPVVSKDSIVSDIIKTDDTSSDVLVSNDKEVTKPESSIPTGTEENSSDIKAIQEDDGTIAERVVLLINDFRTDEGVCEATVLPKLTEYAEYRSHQLTTNFEHDIIDERAAATILKYGQYINPVLYGMTGEPYYTANAREAIGKGSLFGTVDQIAERIATGFRNSKEHWSYVGGDEYKYIAVGITCENNYWYCDIAMSRTNTDN